MSTTASTTSQSTGTTSTGVSRLASKRVLIDARDPRQLFDDLVFDNAEICSDCFSRIRDEETIDHDGWGCGNHPDQVRQRVSDGEVGYDDHDHDRYGELRSYNSATVCGVCGQLHGRARDDPLSKQQALSRLPQLVRRLNEQRLAVDVDSMYSVVGHLKSQPKYQGRDSEIFAAAVWMGLRDAAKPR